MPRGWQARETVFKTPHTNTLVFTFRLIMQSPGQVGWIVKTEYIFSNIYKILLNVSQKWPVKSKSKGAITIIYSTIYRFLGETADWMWTESLTVYSLVSWYLLFQTWVQFMEQKLFCINSLETISLFCLGAGNFQMCSSRCFHMCSSFSGCIAFDGIFILFFIFVLVREHYEIRTLALVLCYVFLFG